jgi:hypothetical protein
VSLAGGSRGFFYKVFLNLTPPAADAFYNALWDDNAQTVGQIVPDLVSVGEILCDSQIRFDTQGVTLVQLVPANTPELGDSTYCQYGLGSR